MTIRKAISERETPVRNAFLGSLLGHILLLVLVLLSSYFWAPSTLLLGGGIGGGSSTDLISVGLVEELSGGAGMYKPGIVPRPQVAPAPPSERKVEQAEPEPDEPVFLEKSTTRPKAPDPVRNSGAPRKTEETPSEGVIPQRAEPGSGGQASTSPGGGGGLGGGLGIQIGGGRSGSGVDSWYVRQLEQRVGQNWLRTSLQGLTRRVRTEISFEVARNGVIENIVITRPSGVRSVDQAARRAVQASSPLPPVPVELRNRTLRVMAVFVYPPP